MRHLERRLEALTDPVSAFGILELRGLVTDEFSPLYFPERIGGLPAALAHALGELEPS